MKIIRELDNFPAAAPPFRATGATMTGEGQGGAKIRFQFDDPPGRSYPSFRLRNARRSQTLTSW